MKILIPTNSVDGTTDILVKLAEAQQINVFRWNIDLWDHYEINITDGKFEIQDPIGRSFCIFRDDHYLLWRKPFANLMQFDEKILNSADQKNARQNLVEFLHSMTTIMKNGGRVRLIDPFADIRIPKIVQLEFASKYFNVPKYEYSIQKNSEISAQQRAVAKPLGDPSLVDENIFFTSIVKPQELYRPYPWFIQEAILGGSDVTCVHILGENRFFACEYERTDNDVDWRTEINTDNQSVWKKFDDGYTSKWSSVINKYMSELGLKYGRLDFISKKGTLYFLEVNPNGQFGWLDDDTMELHQRFLDSALDSRARVQVF